MAGFTPSPDPSASRQNRSAWGRPFSTRAPELHCAWSTGLGASRASRFYQGSWSEAGAIQIRTLVGPSGFILTSPQGSAALPAPETGGPGGVPCKHWPAKQVLDVGTGAIISEGAGY